MTQHVIDQAQSCVAMFNEIRADMPKTDLWNRRSGPREEVEFDPNLYLDALPHLQLMPGYTLDFYYNWCDMAGNPWVYARKIGDPPFSEDVMETQLRKVKNYRDTYSPIRYLLPDGSPESWFELVVFERLADQFYLFWHSNYNDFRFVTTQEEINAIAEKIRLEPEMLARARSMDHRIIVSVGESECKVEYCGFSEWKGFTRYETTIKREPPCVVMNTAPIENIPYHCGICF